MQISTSAAMSLCNMNTDASSQGDTVLSRVASFNAEDFESEEDTIKDVEHRHDFLSWYDDVVDMCVHLDTLMTKRNELGTDLKNTFNFVENLKVPHCYEYARLAFARGFSELMDDFEFLSFDMDAFADRVEFHESMLKMHGDKDTSDWSSKSLQAFIELYATRLEMIEDEIKIRKADGQDMLTHSQQISRPCGF